MKRSSFGRKICERFTWVVMLCLAPLFVGCGNKVDSQTVADVEVLAFDLKECAQATVLIKDQLTALNPAESVAVASFLKDHSDGLSVQAISIAEVARALRAKPTLTDQVREGLPAAANRAANRVANFTNMSKRIVAKDPAKQPDVDNWIGTHVVRLVAIHAKLQKFEAAVRVPDKSKPVEAPVAPKPAALLDAAPATAVAREGDPGDR